MAKRKIARGSVRRLLIVISEIQGLAGKAWASHQNDRDPHGFEEGQDALLEISKLCVEATDDYDPIREKATNATP